MAPKLSWAGTYVCIFGIATFNLHFSPLEFISSNENFVPKDITSGSNEHKITTSQTSGRRFLAMVTSFTGSHERRAKFFLAWHGVRPAAFCKHTTNRLPGPQRCGLSSRTPTCYFQSNPNNYIALHRLRGLTSLRVGISLCMPPYAQFLSVPVVPACAATPPIAGQHVSRGYGYRH